MKAYIDGEDVEVTFGPTHSGALTYMPPRRWLPRIRLRHTGVYWEARWVSQNDSYLGQEAPTRRAAVRAVIRAARYQKWPLITRPEL